MKLIEDIIRENVRQVLNEYSTDKHIVELYNILSLDEKGQKEYIENYLNDHLYILGEIILDFYKYLDYAKLLVDVIERGEEVIQELKKKMTDEYTTHIYGMAVNDLSPIIEISKIYNAYKKDGTIIKNNNLINELKNSRFDNIFDIYYRNLERYTYFPFFNYKDPKFIQNQWLIHFSKESNIQSIFKNGFQYGKNLRNLGIGWGKSEEQNKQDKFCFAYTFDSFIDSEIINLNYWRYGNNAILFQASGIEVTYKEINDRMTIFWGPSAKNFISINHENYENLSDFNLYYDPKKKGYFGKKSDGSKIYVDAKYYLQKKLNSKEDEEYWYKAEEDINKCWTVRSIKNNKILFVTYDETFRELKQWLDNNFAQYHNSIVNYNTNKRFRDYETNYKR